MQKQIKNLLIALGIIVILTIIGFYSFSRGNLLQGYLQVYPKPNINNTAFSISKPATAVYPNKLIANSENKIFEFNINTSSKISFTKSKSKNYNSTNNNNFLTITLSTNKNFSNIESCQLYMINPSYNSKTLLDKISNNTSNFIINKLNASLKFNFSSNGYSLPPNSSVRFRVTCDLNQSIATQTISASLNKSLNSQQSPIKYTNSQNQNTNYTPQTNIVGPILSF